MNLLVIGVPFAALILSNAFASAAIFNGVLQLTIFIVTAMIPGKLVVHLHRINLVRVENVHYDLLMMSKKEAPRKHTWVLPRKVAKMV